MLSSDLLNPKLWLSRAYTSSDHMGNHAQKVGVFFSFPCWFWGDTYWFSRLLSAQYLGIAPGVVSDSGVVKDHSLCGE